MQIFEGIVHSRTKKAVYFEGHYWHAPMWLPMSQLEIEEDGEGYVISLKDWLANKKQLYEFREYTQEQIEAMEAT